MKKPNILIIITDQQSGSAMSCVGNENVKTPGIDSIADNGVVFSKAYCTNPVCVPSRVSMFTGKMPHRAKIYSNVHKAKDLDKFRWLGKHLAENGYDCGYFGKWHLVIQRWRKWIHGFKKTYISWGKNRDENTIPHVTKFLRKKREKPFFAVASFVNPHDICQFARRQALPNGEIPEPPESDEFPELPSSFNVPENEPDTIREANQESWKRYPTKDWDKRDWREYLWGYYRLVELADKWIGKVMDSVRKYCDLENTVIIFVSDHGEGMASHHWNQKQVLYETTTRVPFIISQKGTTLHGKINNTQLASTGLDLFPTICDFVGISPPKDLFGMSLKDVATGKRDKIERDFVMSETEFGGFVKWAGDHFGRANGRMIRTEQFKYMVYSKGKIREQLIDIDKDPGEMNNLATDPNYKEVLNRHRELLEKWCKKTEDDFDYISSEI
ncbi:MAG: sulfatase-like hydrolase/transferase [Candidatus Lokiarchaeota archaeon]|nr:sulfatase-like hydrolase/transferase [Candidatus Lokiarchaeota archaeon]